MGLTFDLESQGHILFILVDFVGVHVKIDSLEKIKMSPRLKID